jgi:hypothetical protein
MTARTLVLAAGLLGAVACRSGTVLVQQCTSNSQCSTNFRCALGGPFQGTCLCSNDAACPQDAGPATCNPDGICQVKVGCVSNSDCDGQSYCDTNLGECVGGSACSSDVDCPIGQICDTSQTTCVAGCHSDGDCPLDEPCTCANGLECQCPPDSGTFIDPASYDRSTCEVGACRSDTCAGNTDLCPYNDDCVGTADGGLSVCELDPRMGVLCQNCVGSVAGGACDVPNSQGANFCLIDPHGSNLYCGVDCSQGQSCPSGYACQDVVILTQNLCASDSQCTPSTLTCSTADGGDDGGNGCPPDSPCVNGFCGSYCVINEGNNQGFCTCVTDSDCPKDTCEGGTCRISQQPCIEGPAGDATCAAQISCVDLNGERGCHIGRNCAPTHGLYCPVNVQQ